MYARWPSGWAFDYARSSGSAGNSLFVYWSLELVYGYSSWFGATACRSGNGDRVRAVLCADLSRHRVAAIGRRRLAVGRGVTNAPQTAPPDRNARIQPPTPHYRETKYRAPQVAWRRIASVRRVRLRPAEEDA